MIRTIFPTPFADIEIGDGLPPYMIAEIGLNHNGSEELARDMIYQAALSGAHFVKFQKRSPADLATASFLDQPFEKCPALGNTQRAVRNRLELSLDVYKRLNQYAESLGLIFFASAFDIPSLRFLQQAGTKIIKVASHSITNGPLLKEIANSGLSVIASLGATTDSEREIATSILKKNPLVLMYCVSSYPTPDNLIKLDTIAYLREKYRLPVGFSSHEVGIEVSIAATVLGACMLERHFTIDRSMVGLDQGISLEPKEFGQMTTSARRLFNVRGVSKEIQQAEFVAKNAYHVSVCAARPIAPGTRISNDMLVCKQPLSDREQFFTGFELDALIGSEVTTTIPADTPIPRHAVRKISA